jgi:hypothetical protein
MSAAPLLDWMPPAPSYPDGVPPDVCLQFEKLALELRGLGFDRYSADAILHRVRWHFNVERGDRGFKVNNDYAAPLARWFLKRHPGAKGFFELRTARAAPIRAYVD